ncbi:MAG: hypothetical protein ACYCXX_11345 [Acidiferrobacter thiooxydans]
MTDCDYNAGVWLSAAGICLVMVGAWFVAYEVVNQFEGETHGGVTSMGGLTRIRKLGAFASWETKKNTAMWLGLILITLGSLAQLAGLFY